MAFFPRQRAGSVSGSKPMSSESLFSGVFSSMRSHAGPTVNQNTALNLPAVYCAVGIIADALAMLPFDVLQNVNGKKQKVSDHPISDLLNHSPNPYMSAMTLRQTQMFHALLWGNGYQEIERNGAGQPVSIWPLMPDATKPVKKPTEDRLYYQTSIAGQGFNIEKDDVLHIPAMGYDGYVGYSPVSVCRNAIGLGLATEEYGSKFFANDAKSGGFLQHPGKLSDTAQKNIMDGVEKKSGLDNAHRIKILEEGMKFVSTTIPPEDAQFLGTREFQIAEIARIYRVPLVLLQSMEKATSWGSGIESMMLGFIGWTLSPWIIKTEQEINRKMFTESEREKGFYCKMNLNAIMRADMAARAAFYKEGILNGYMTRNEVREKEDWNPIEGLDKPLIPLNMTPDGEKTDEE